MFNSPSWLGCEVGGPAAEPDEAPGEGPEGGPEDGPVVEPVEGPGVGPVELFCSGFSGDLVSDWKIRVNT